MWSCNPIMIYRVIVGGPHPSLLPVVRREYQEKTRVKCAKGSITRSRRSIIREFVIATYIISRPLDCTDRNVRIRRAMYTSSNVHFPCNYGTFTFSFLILLFSFGGYGRCGTACARFSETAPGFSKTRFHSTDNVARARHGSLNVVRGITKKSFH